jgi:signal peptidase I
MPTAKRQLIAIVIFLVIASFCLLMFRRAVVTGNSMLPTYKNGDVVIAAKMVGTLKRGDVVLVLKDSEVIIKRVSALPGETLQGDEAFNYGRAWDRFEQPPPPADPLKEIRVPADSIAVLGDNASVSEDSRIFGPVPLTDILGKVINARPKRQSNSDTPDSDL